MARASLLVVDDEPIIRDTLAEFLQRERYSVQKCGSGEEALALAARHCFDVILCDINLPGIDGLEVLDRVLQISPDTLVVLITAYATVESAVEAFQSGAHDYLMKPILLHEVSGKVRRLLAQRDLHRENQWLRRELSRDDNDMVVGRSPAMQRAYAVAQKVAPTQSTVLITGESGTGKDLMARAIHRLAQPAKPSARFVPVSCAAIPPEHLENQLFGHRRGAFPGAERDEPGVFLHAGAGTVFLDEIMELPLALQGKLLRVIEQKEVLPVGASAPVTMEARIIAASNRDLELEVREGRFREELFYRLNVVRIELPPLRDRREDVPELVEALLARHARTLRKPIRGASHAAMQMLMNARWKGNIRELDNALQRAVILADGPLIEPGDLPPDLQPADGDPFAVDDLSAAVARFERLHIERIMRLTPDKRDAARRLGIGLSSLYRKLDEK